MDGCALVAFGTESRRPTIICIQEAAMPEMPGPDWVVLARDSDLAAPAAPLLPRSPSDEDDL